jgi:15-cis-phytoene synthase
MSDADRHDTAPRGVLDGISEADRRDSSPRGVLRRMSDDVATKTMSNSAPPNKHTTTPRAALDGAHAADDSTFAPAMRLLSEPSRADVRTLYGVLRTIDDLVDEDDPRAPERVEALERWARGGVPDSPEAHALSQLAERHPLPREQLLEFCRGMRHDIAREAIGDDADFDRYCQQAGGSVGIVLAVLLGAAGPRAQDAQQGMAALGRAMQVTNILRDIDDDLATRRVYISQTAIERFGFPAPGAREELLRDHIARADALYEEGLPAIGLLARGRAAMALSAVLYREILRQIEREGFGRRPGRVVVPLAHRNLLANRNQRAIMTTRPGGGR